jgi:hypothetical protein
VLSSVRRAALGLTTAVALSAGLLAPPASAAQSTGQPTAQPTARPTARADAAADWLAGELQGGLMITEFRDQDGNLIPDFGLTLDVDLAMRDLRVRPGTRQRILDAIEPRTGEYVGTGPNRSAGGLGKLLTAVLRERIDPATYAGGTLVRQLERRVHTADDSNRGRAVDAFDPTSTFGQDFSNTIGQSFVVRALSLAGSDLAGVTARYLLRQQCARGFFAGALGSADTVCATGGGSGTGPSVDATALAVHALIVADRRDVVRHRRVHRALVAAEAWLVRKQRAGGAFSADGVANANSTGLAAAALAALGRDRRADRAAEWLRARQVTRALAQDGALGGERGAVAFDRAAFRAAVDNGIGRGARDQVRRPTAQAAVGLDALRRG